MPLIVSRLWTIYCTSCCRKVDVGNEYVSTITKMKFTCSFTWTTEEWGHPNHANELVQLYDIIALHKNGHRKERTLKRATSVNKRTSW